MTITRQMVSPETLLRCLDEAMSHPLDLLLLGPNGDTVFRCTLDPPTIDGDPVGFQPCTYTWSKLIVFETAITITATALEFPGCGVRVGRSIGCVAHLAPGEGLQFEYSHDLNRFDQETADAQTRALWVERLSDVIGTPAHD